MPTWTIADATPHEVPDTHITRDTQLHEPVTNTVIIHGPATVEAHADINGTIHVATGATLITWAAVNGTITLDDDATLTTHGSINGHAQRRPDNPARHP